MRATRSLFARSHFGFKNAGVVPSPRAIEKTVTENFPLIDEHAGTNIPDYLKERGLTDGEISAIPEMFFKRASTPSNLMLIDREVASRCRGFCHPHRIQFHFGLQLTWVLLRRVDRTDRVRSVKRPTHLGIRPRRWCYVTVIVTVLSEPQTLRITFEFGSSTPGLYFGILRSNVTLSN